MDLKKLAQESDYQWKIAPTGKMRVPAVIYGSPELMRDMDDKVYEQDRRPIGCSRIRATNDAYLTQANTTWLCRWIRDPGSVYV